MGRTLREKLEASRKRKAVTKSASLVKLARADKEERALSVKKPITTVDDIIAVGKAIDIIVNQSRIPLLGLEKSEHLRQVLQSMKMTKQ